MNTQFKTQCLTLRKKGLSLNKIVQITGRPKTSVYAHIRTIPLSEMGKLRWLKESTARIISFNRARKGISSLGRYPRPFTKWTPGLVSLVGHLIFDGEIKETGCIYNNRSSALIEKVAREMRRIYNFPPKEYRNMETGVSRISYHNIGLGALVQQKSRELLEKIERFPLALQKSFLKAFFDDEGCMDFRPKKSTRKIRGYQKDTKILHLIQKLLSNTGIPSRIELPNEVVIVGKENLLAFQRRVGFSAGIKMNGLRSNSRWKKNIEKRSLLKRAIASYQS